MMAKEFIKLTQDLMTGIPVIDKQHELFFKKVNDFLVYSSTNQSMPHCEKMLKDFHDYAKGHFSTEEQFMLKYKYPELEKQRKEHREYLIKVDKLMILFKQTGNTTDFVRKVQIEVINWFKNHILTYDKVMVKFLKSQDDENESAE